MGASTGPWRPEASRNVAATNLLTSSDEDEDGSDLTGDAHGEPVSMPTEGWQPEEAEGGPLSPDAALEIALDVGLGNGASTGLRTGARWNAIPICLPPSHEEEGESRAAEEPHGEGVHGTLAGATGAEPTELRTSNANNGGDGLVDAIMAHFQATAPPPVVGQTIAERLRTEPRRGMTEDELATSEHGLPIGSGGGRVMTPVTPDPPVQAVNPTVAPTAGPGDVSFEQACREYILRNQLYNHVRGQCFSCSRSRRN